MRVFYGKYSLNNQTEDINLNKIASDFNSSELSGYKLISDRHLSIAVFYNPDMLIDNNLFFRGDVSNITICFSGRVYNRAEIQNSFLNGKLYSGDAELVHDLFVKYGESFVNILNGDFVFVIADELNERLYLFRDHVGIRPLAYSVNDQSIFFSVDYLGICKFVDDDRSIEKEFLLHFIQNSDFTDLKTLPSRKVEKILPGHYVVFDKGGAVQKKYWFPEKLKTLKRGTAESAIETLRNLLYDAIKIRCDENNIAAAHLSGGLDSGIVAAVARKFYYAKNVFYGFSWSPDYETELEGYFDERDLIKEIAADSDIIPIFCNIRVDEFWNNLSDWRYYSYQFYEHKIAEEAKKRNIKLIFSGWGGDNFLSINNRGLFFDLFFSLNWLSFLRRKPLHKPHQLIGTLFYNVFLPAIGLGFLIRQPNEKWQMKYFYPEYNIVPSKYKKLFRYTSRRSVHLIMLYDYLYPFRTEAWDIFGAIHGIEYRYPLLDKRIIEFMLQIPSKVIASFPYPRPLIREVAKGILPERVRLHLDKEDAARLFNLYKMFMDTLPYLFNELNDFKKNPDLDFLNFKNIEEDMIKLKEKKFEHDETDFLYLLINIKQMHEFTKGYKQ